MNALYSRSEDFSGDIDSIVHTFRHRRHLFLLESSFKDVHRGRYSFIGFDPAECIAADGKDALDGLRAKFENYRRTIKTDLTPLYAGIVGFIGYDYGLYQEGIAAKTKEDNVSDVWFGFYETIITIDHFTNKIHITSIATQAVVDAVYEQIKTTTATDYKSETTCVLDVTTLKSNFTKSDYLKAVDRARAYIAAGDIYQVNLSQKFTLEVKSNSINAFKIYESLRDNSPAPFGCFLDGGAFQIISSSPERFLRLCGSTLQTRPMKGTAKRGVTDEQDEQNKSELIMSPKERAELLMITDLLRNDLGRVCTYGTVCVQNRREIEAYKTVYQATSTIEGEISEDKDCFDVLKSMLPGGSITGCPKIRAMTIIEELEPTRRGVYTGIMGYINFSGAMDFNVLIRTLVLTQDKITYQVGGGIVYDSDAVKEYEETLIKAEAIQKTIENLFAVQASA